MKKISHRASRCALALSLSLACALPGMAQSTTGSGTGVGTTSRTVTDTRNDTDDRDYGWLGLLGLIGLAGLRRKKDDHTDKRHTTGVSRRASQASAKAIHPVFRQKGLKLRNKFLQVALIDRPAAQKPMDLN